MEKFAFETKEFLDLVNDPKFREEFAKQESKEGIKNLFAKNGVAMSDEDLVTFSKMVAVAQTQEVSEEMLELVSGGANSEEKPVKGKKFSQYLGEFVGEHPYLTFFAVTNTVAAIAGIPVGVARAFRE